MKFNLNGAIKLIISVKTPFTLEIVHEVFGGAVA